MPQPRKYPRPEGFTATARFHVRYADTDQMGHVYYANYLIYFEMARSEWMRSAGLPYSKFENMGYIVPVVEAHVRYRRRIFYDDLVEVKTGVKPVSKTRFRFSYEVRRAGEEPILADGWTVHTVLDGDGRPQRIPDLFLDMMERHAGGGEPGETRD
ncbi:MAG TPA: acyl-CoA thioesterase [Bacteroidetes bacterium]|nr:acyl-CoA thioesterase [Bacteroidota bacterium]